MVLAHNFRSLSPWSWWLWANSEAILMVKADGRGQLVASWESKGRDTDGGGKEHVHN